MDIETVTKLNDIYKPLCDKSLEICNYLKQNNYTVSMGFYNNHSIRYNDEFITEHYPIPVISFDKVCDIGVDIDTIFIEFILPKEKAVCIDYIELTKKYKIEVYGSDNYLHDFYNEQMISSDIVKKISNSGESKICIAFYVKIEYKTSEIVKIIQLMELQTDPQTDR